MVVTINPHTGQAEVFVSKLVVEDVQDPMIEMTLTQAHQVNPTAKLGDYVEVAEFPENFGRIAAQTAKQVITQRIREAERDTVYAEYEGRAGEIINGVVRNVDARSHNVTIGLGKAEALLPRSEQIPGEHYRFSQRVRAYIEEVARDAHGPAITVSRTHPDLLKRLLEMEVPEIANGMVEVKAHCARAWLSLQGGGGGVADWRGPGGLVRGHARRAHPEYRQRAGRRKDRCGGVVGQRARVYRQFAQPGQGCAGAAQRAWTRRPSSLCLIGRCRWPSAKRGRMLASPPS